MIKDINITITLTCHRVEILELLRQEMIKHDVIILEEPRNKYFNDLLNGKLSIDDYVRSTDQAFPIYAKLQAELVIEMYKLGKKILQLEPYLEILNRIYEAIEKNELSRIISDPRVRLVKEVEGKVSKALIEYYEAFLKETFDEIVNKVVNYAKADAERFKLRDELRGHEIVEMILRGEISGKVLVESGYMHIHLVKYLRRVFKNLRVISIPAMACHSIGLNFMLSPGDELTLAYIINRKLDPKKEKLLAARSLIYISLVSKKEKVPTKDNPYPHLFEEHKIISFVNKLNYESCRRLFEKIRKYYLGKS